MKSPRWLISLLTLGSLAVRSTPVAGEDAKAPVERKAGLAQGIPQTGDLTDRAAIFAQDFSGAKIGEVPDGFLVLDGQFAVREDGGNRFLELPGAPLDTFGVAFGPNEAAGLQVQARVFATKQGRKFPTFAAGLNGVGGFKVRVSPAKKSLELLKGEEIKAATPFEWRSGEWTQLELQVRKTDAGFQVEAKAWQGDTEPGAWMVSLNEKESMHAGPAALWGMPFSGTPLRFDDLKIIRVP